MNTTIHVAQVICDHEGNLIADHPFSWEQTMAKDKYKALLGDGNARVSMSMSEKMGGPYGYSSVSINVSVSVNCNQDENTIAKAQDAAFTEVALGLDTWFEKAHKILNSHLAQFYSDN